MWTNISALAQKAKEAASIIENQINDSLGDGSGGASPSSPAAGAADGSLDNMGGDEAADSDERVPGSDGWEKCDDISSDDGGEDEQVKQPEKENRPQEMSFVDLKSAAADIPKNVSGGLESNAALLDALARIEALEKQVNSLKDELATAREESQNYHATNLLLEEQVKELQEQGKEEIKCLEESGESEK